MEIRAFDQKLDLKKQRDLFKECFPETIGTSLEKEDHYIWKFHSFPHSVKSYEYVTYDGYDMIGYYAALPYKYSINNSTYIVGMVCDVMTGIKARGKGVFTKMGIYSTDEMRNQGLAFTTGYPIRPEVIPGHIKAGWKKLFKLPLYINFIKGNKLLQSKNLGCFAFIFNIIINLYNFGLKLLFPSPKVELEIYNISDIDEIKGFKEFIQKWQQEQVIYLHKSTEFLKWRLGAPDKQYKLHIARKNDIIVGYAVSSFTIKENVPSVVIIDLSFLNAYKKNIPYFIRKLKVYAKENNQESLMIMFSEFMTKKYKLLQCGFLKSPYKFWLILKQFDSNIPSHIIEDDANWHLGWIDSDNF